MDAMCIGIGLMLYVSALDWRQVNWFLRDSFLWERTKAIHFVMFVEAHLNELVFVPIPHLTLMSFCTQGLPGVAESTVSISGGKFSPSGKDTRQTDEGWEKVFCLAPSTVCDSTPLPESEDYLLGGWILRLRLRLRAEWQVRGILRRMKIFSSKKPIQKEICCYVHWFWIDVMCIGIGLML